MPSDNKQDPLHNADKRKLWLHRKAHTDRSRQQTKEKEARSTRQKGRRHKLLSSLAGGPRKDELSTEERRHKRENKTVAP